MDKIPKCQDSMGFVLDVVGDATASAFRSRLERKLSSLLLGKAQKNLISSSWHAQSLHVQSFLAALADVRDLKCTPTLTLIHL